MLEQRAKMRQDVFNVDPDPRPCNVTSALNPSCRKTVRESHEKQSSIDQYIQLDYRPLYPLK